MRQVVKLPDDLNCKLLNALGTQKAHSGRKKTCSVFSQKFLTNL